MNPVVSVQYDHYLKHQVSNSLEVESRFGAATLPIPGPDEGKTCIVLLLFEDGRRSRAPECNTLANFYVMQCAEVAPARILFERS